uniref:ShKT domain-containing protein n=1 Tax=Panagrolaimus sp. ES5 TaxID=591445 RepID=A0AC34F8D0_9BILA
MYALAQILFYQFLETCKDFVECHGLKALCQHEIYHELMKKQCRRTCDVCVPESEGCKDRHKNCVGFKDDGFCDNPVYSAEERTYLCGNTCQLC